MQHKEPQVIVNTGLYSAMAGELGLDIMIGFI
jgi:hypothetical protein